MTARRLACRAVTRCQGPAPGKHPAGRGAGRGLEHPAFRAYRFRHENPFRRGVGGRLAARRGERAGPRVLGCGLWQLGTGWRRRFWRGLRRGHGGPRERGAGGRRVGGRRRRRGRGQSCRTGNRWQRRIVRRHPAHPDGRGQRRGGAILRQRGRSPGHAGRGLSGRDAARGYLLGMAGTARKPGQSNRPAKRASAFSHGTKDRATSGAVGSTCGSPALRAAGAIGHGSNQAGRVGFRPVRSTRRTPPSPIGRPDRGPTRAGQTVLSVQAAAVTGGFAPAAIPPRRQTASHCTGRRSGCCPRSPRLPR